MQEVASEEYMDWLALTTCAIGMRFETGPKN